MAKEKKMPIMGHFAEMRKRFFRGVIAVIIATLLSFIFFNQIMAVLTAPNPELDLTTITIMEPLSIFFRVCLTAGVILAMPYLVYQLFAFLAPALSSNEKRYVYTAVPFIGGLFLAGVAFAYFVALPPAMRFFGTFGSDWVNIEPTISSYINIVTRLIIGVGLSFETPLIIMVLARLGVVSPEWLARKRKIWVVIAFVLAAIITPTFDPINQTIIAVPLIVLYELSIWLAKLVYKRKPKPVPIESDSSR